LLRAVDAEKGILEILKGKKKKVTTIGRHAIPHRHQLAFDTAQNLSIERKKSESLQQTEAKSVVYVRERRRRVA
jgi:hypothetical protein